MRGRGDKATQTEDAGQAKRYRVTGFEAPLTIDLPEGGHETFEEGQEFAASEWPMPHLTIPNQLAHGTIEEVN